MPVLTSRGCPFGCIYCHNIFGKTFRARSAHNVLEEIKWLKKSYDIEELEIIDDIFNFDKERAKDIMKGVIMSGLGIKISFPNGIKYESVDDELLELFKNAGVYRLAFGIESGNDRIQGIIHKKIDLEKMKAIIDKTVNMGFFVSGFFQLGLPGETRKEMLDTIGYAVSTKLHTASFHLTVPFPGTEMNRKYVKDISSALFASCRDISVNVSAVSDRELIRLKRHAMNRFYISISRIMRTYKVFPIKRRLLGNFINVISELLWGRWVVNT
jgi:radical SAM superfamily enzyme YgiQ (UPF0313 family)